MHLLFAMHDSDLVNHPGTRLIKPEDAPRLNEQGFGIFWTVNDFKGRRTKDKLVKINAWAADIDAGTKAEMKARIESAPLVPTLVVETKRGYHVYWAAKDAKPEHWKAIVWDRLVPYFGADKNAKDICRILRMPGFNHMKDPSDPFMIKTVWEHRVAYTEVQMASAFPSVISEETKRQDVRTIVRHGAHGNSLWEKVWSLNCEEGLERLSGHSSVNGETYSFHMNSSGTKNIFVNGKPTSCWVDRDGKIGSFSGGGPHIGRWLNWYGLSWSEVARVIKEVFPECHP
jgi:hypothetical protein